MSGTITPYTKVLLKAKNEGDATWAVIMDVNIPYTPNRTAAAKHREVARTRAALDKRYSVIEIKYQDYDV